MSESKNSEVELSFKADSIKHSEIPQINRGETNHLLEAINSTNLDLEIQEEALIVPNDPILIVKPDMDT